MDDFLLISFRLKRELDQTVQNAIYNFNITGFEVDDPVEKRHLLSQLPEWEVSDIKIEDDGYIDYKVFFVDDDEGERAMNQVLIFMKSLVADFDYEFEYIDNSNWEDEWKKSYKSFPIGEKVWIKPSWEDHFPEDKLVIEIDPKMAFGTGTHETTSLCIEYAQNLDLSEKKVLDIGAGSGILSILASKLKAKQVDACDIDQFALDNAKENLTINKVDNVNVFYSDLFSKVEDKYDLIFANILAEILLDMIEQAFEYLNENGLLVLSGIILEKKDLVKNKLLEEGYTIKEEIEKGEWVLLVAQL
ncbi:MAG: 50S ribosomal protein L11 methyltransferase [Tissierellia bacterium]|nr:50S ribosomal protein L11 methyltransferase [Tissierellia bacterium]